MVKVNDNYLKLPGSYLFSAIAKKVNAYTAANPDKKIIRLGIGDVRQYPGDFQRGRGNCRLRSGLSGLRGFQRHGRQNRGV